MDTQRILKLNPNPNPNSTLKLENCVFCRVRILLFVLLYFFLKIKMLSANEMRLKNLDILFVTCVTLLIRLFLHVNFSRNNSPAKLFVLFLLFRFESFPRSIESMFSKCFIKKIAQIWQLQIKLILQLLAPGAFCTSHI